MPTSKLPVSAYAAKEAAERFLAAWSVYHRRWAQEPEPRRAFGGVIGACKERAALRRASMELTRALAAIRRPSSL